MLDINSKSSVLFAIKNHCETKEEREQIIKMLLEVYLCYKKISNKYDIPFYDEYQREPIIAYSYDDVEGFILEYRDVVGQEFQIRLKSEMVFDSNYVSLYENECRNKYINKYINIIDKNTKSLERSLRDLKVASQKLNSILC